MCGIHHNFFICVEYAIIHENYLVQANTHKQTCLLVAAIVLLIAMPLDVSVFGYARDVAGGVDNEFFWQLRVPGNREWFYLDIIRKLN